MGLALWWDCKFEVYTQLPLAGSCGLQELSPNPESGTTCLRLSGLDKDAPMQLLHAAGGLGLQSSGVEVARMLSCSSGAQEPQSASSSNVQFL